MKLTLTLDGSLSEIKRAIVALENSNVDMSGNAQGRSTDLEAFVQELAFTGRKAVAQLVYVLLKNQTHIPLEDRQISREHWQDICESTREEFNGVLGSVGRSWAKHSDDANPFVSQGINEHGNHMHGIQDGELLHDLFKLLFKSERSE
ncbi:hypothetical protein GKO48_14210 [Candidatus Lucifugimonas marina]|jgi:hypothetical protein|uniref:Uncharacterized protein n=1 Tax=Candidatus Lucifugimonas marina TaxID=3038979 RepID=A0AAJ5ZGE2_9CHLR|nr:hypothetical protein GKO48_14210 [SAR202 cluster bacterium JH1073]